MTISKKTTSKKKAVTKKRNRMAGKVKTVTQKHKRNKNNLTDDEQAFADALMTNRDGSNATEIIVRLNPKIKRATCRNKASQWMKDVRIRAYMDDMRQRVEDKVEYGLVEWRTDVLRLKSIAMGDEARKQTVTIKNEEGESVKVQLEDVKEFEGAVAKGALELLAKQMKLLTDKQELGLTEQMMELFAKVKPTLGPPSLRHEK